MNKMLVAFLLTFGLYAGSASAITVTLNPANQEVLTIGDGVIASPTGLEVDNFSQSQPTVASGPDIPIDFWVGLNVLAASVNSTITAEDQSTVYREPGFLLDPAAWTAVGLRNADKRQHDIADPLVQLAVIVNHQRIGREGCDQ